MSHNPVSTRPAEQFLLAAKRAEIQALKSLAANCEVVALTGELIHSLQRERGISNVFLASGGTRFAGQRLVQASNSQASAAALIARFDVHALEDSRGIAGMRLLNGIAFVLQGLDELDGLRQRIALLQVSPLDTMHAISRLIAGLLAIIFSAADISNNPAVTALLVALFNLLQGKEYAGQERGLGSMGFAAGHFDETLCERLLHLQQGQTRSFVEFQKFADAEMQQDWLRLENSAQFAELSKLRGVIARLADGAPVTPEISEVWYELTTWRIDRMHDLEQALTDALLATSRQQLETAKASQQIYQTHVSTLSGSVADDRSSSLFDPLPIPGDDETQTAPTVTPELARSVHELVRAQADHIRQLSEELASSRRALADRKCIERAKGILMKSLGISEEQAHARLQRQAMTRNMRLVDLANAVIETHEATRGALP
ncbi:nitrate regulatory protein [Solimonas marina]|uniref:ANTAR domain-containing protein n=1 Tax=Solimonas marina TaxID=2714601 RepID=A0A969WDW5_9GAMM|nr:nitrate regulatory protein [Solimonas marina]NKF24280.1 ANTAR domain-containing protein [Solimonas marina]